MSKKLLIVESPAKTKTLARFLGSDFNILATVGHIRDLPKSKLGIDPDNNFAVDYTVIKGKEKVKQIGTLERTEQFRIVYRPPNEEQSQHLSQKDMVWHGYLSSRMFHGRGQID